MTMPNNFQPMQNVPMPQTYPAPSAGISHVAEVYSRESVNDYPVTPGSTVLLIQFLTQNSGKFWLKTKDQYCRPIPPIEFDFSLTNNYQQSQPQPQQNQQVYQQPVQPQTNQNEFVTKSDFDELKNMVSELRDAFK